MENFDITYLDVYEIQNRLCDYNENAQTILDDAISNIASLEHDKTFSGKAARSIKAYFKEVHIPIAQGLQALFRAVSDQYARELAIKFTNNPAVGASSEARWSASDMKSKMDILQNQRDGNLQAANNHLNRAVQSIPTGVHLSIPNIGVWSNGVSQTRGEVVNVKRAVQEIDDSARAAFSRGDEHIEDLKLQITRAISFAQDPMKKGISNYTPGSFDSSALTKATAVCVDDINEHYDEVRDSYLNAANMNEQHLQILQEQAMREQAEIADRNAILSTIGLVASGVGVVLAVAACATPVGVLVVGAVGVVSLTFQMLETKDRMQQARDKKNRLNGGNDGDDGFDAASTLVDDIDRFSGDADFAVNAKKETGRYTSLDASDGADRAKGLTSASRGVILNAFSQNIGEDNEDAARIIDVGNSVWDGAEGVGEIVGKGATKIGRASGVTSVVSAATDIGVAIGDKQMSDIQNTMDQNNADLQDTINRRSKIESSTGFSVSAA